MLSWLQHRWTGLWLMFMALGAIITFLYLSNVHKLPTFSIDGHTVYDSGDNSVVLMVIDGLRYDFVTAEYMPFTGELLKNKTGCIYVSVAEPPTVTMPRIKSPERKVEKAQWRRTINFWRDIFANITTNLVVFVQAMMTGSVSTFADVALNFGAPAVRGDSVLRVADARGRRSILYGDDTWLRLHLDKVLKVDEKNKTNFDFLVLHYLGLDHIGHLEGARSDKIKPKLLEMDAVVKKIFEAMLKWHGMRHAGGHEGATPAEVLVPLVVVKSSDFVCPHPGSGGPRADHSVAAERAASRRQRRPHPTLADPYRHAPTPVPAASTGEQSAAKIAKEFYEESLGEMAKYLTESTVEFDMYSIVLAIVLLTFPRHGHHRTTKAGSIVAFIVILIIVTISLTISCYITETKSKMCSFNPIWATAFILIGCAFTTTYFIVKAGIEKITDLSTFRELNAIDYLLITGTLFQSWSFFGTSFIEEEHMTWYFFWNTLMFFVLIRTIVLVVMYLRTMNQTGDRWLFLPDTADWLNAPENALYLQAHLVIGTVATAVVCYRNLSHTNNLKHIHTILTTVSVAAIFCYRIASSALTISPLDVIKTWDHVSIVNVIWGALIAQFVIEILSFVGIFKVCGIKVSQPTNKLTTNTFDYYTPKEKVEDYLESVVQEPWNIEDVKLSLARSLLHLMLNTMMLIVSLLMRPHNVVMVPSIYVTCKLTTICMEHKLLDTKSLRKTDVVDVLSKTLGNSNSLASVDLGSGYVGLREYCPVRVAMRMGLHAYAGPALAGALLFCTIAANAKTVNIFAAHRVYCLVVYCGVATVFRHHLYVWSVFSPKLLYDFVAVLFTVQALGTIASVEVLTHAQSTNLTVQAQSTSLTVQAQSTSLTVQAQSTSVTVQAQSTSITVQAQSTSLTVQAQSTNLTVQAQSTSITVQAQSASLTVQAQSTNLTVQAQSTSITVQAQSASLTVQAQFLAAI
ncbi:putative GPI ethanolamine phosphate transferase 2-like isoform 5 [Operophtera brumata]|uniref:Putative GPI ethanolamine phosphate transferase 2-like isoform 5 n=1 Tax=Operophtera brumata TaxID=104452 RepID=A0A0L7KZ77_OPEBR|nr:putative GPI ethanolamine phosphate transferase 2-like isoform 5 [Operophtera brumata]